MYIINILFNTLKGYFMKLSISVFLSLTFLFSQKLDPINPNLEKIKNMLETASRTGQVVMVEDFTGLS